MKNIKTTGSICIISGTLVLLFFLYLLISKQNAGLKIEIISDAKSFDLYYDTGNGFSESELIQSNKEFLLPEKPIKQIRIDPAVSFPKNSISISKINISRLNKTLISFSGKRLSNQIKQLHQISMVRYNAPSNSTRIYAIGNDPYFLLNLTESQLNKITPPLKFYEKIRTIHILIFLIIILISSVSMIFRKRISAFFKKINDFIDGKELKESSLTNQSGNSGVFSKILNPFNSPGKFWLFYLIVSAIYIVFYTGANSNILTFASHDDALYFEQAKSITQFLWLGNYSSLTLAKMPGYAIFLSFCMATGIPYLLIISILNSLAVAFLLHRSSWVFNKTKIVSFLMGAMLLFNPVFNSELRIYRNQLASICFLIFLGVLISLFNPSTKKESGNMKIINMLVSFLGVGFLFYTREENTLFYGIFALTGILFLLVIKNIKYIKRNLYPAISGILGIVILGLFISVMNKVYYGRFIACERISAPFTTVLHAFHSVDDPDLDPRFPAITASPEKIMHIAGVIPEFNKIANLMCDNNNHGFEDVSTYYDKNDLSLKFSGDYPIPVSHFEWYWISCAEYTGYYSSATEVATFYKNLSEKINNALKTGKLDKRKILFSFGPYCINKDDISAIINLLPKNYNKLLPTKKGFISMYDSFTVKPVPSEGYLAEKLTEWQNKLHVKFLDPNEKTKISKANNSIQNTFWNGWVLFFAYGIFPLIFIASPLAIAVILFSFFRKNRMPAMVLLVLTTAAFAHILLLTILDITVGFNASTPSYFLPSYNTLIISTFIALAIIFNTFNGKIKELKT